MTPDTVAIVDWSAAATPRLGRDSIWLGVAGGGERNLPTRAAAESALRTLISDTVARGRTLLIGLDFAFGYPMGFARALTGHAGAPAAWAWLNDHLTDGPDNRNDRFATAARMNARLPGLGPFWFNATPHDLPGLPRKGSARCGHGLAERRVCDALAPGAQSVWKLGGAGSVGGQALTGQPLLHRLRGAFPGAVAVWPFDPLPAPVVLAEVFPSLLAPQVAMATKADPATPRDAHQVRLLAQALHRLGNLGALLTPGAPPDILAEEGWILGLGHESSLAVSPGG